jgi:hypothetical protein
LLNQVRRDPITRENGIHEALTGRAIYRAAKTLWQTIGGQREQLIYEFQVSAREDHL